MASWGILVLFLSIATVESYYGDHAVQRCGNSYIYHKTYGKSFCCNEKVIYSTYVVDAQSNGTDACCNGCPYNSYRFACCDGSLQPRTPNTRQECCGKKIYDTNRQICCCGKIRAKECGLACCENTFYDRYTHLCCRGILYKRRGITNCCGVRTYHIRCEICCNGVVYKVSDFGKCCDENDDYYYGHSHHHDLFTKREAKKLTKRHDGSPCRSCYRVRRHLGCCGSRVFNYSTERCCGNIVHTNKALHCCSGALYNPSIQRCCYGKVVAKRYGIYTGCCPVYDCQKRYGYYYHHYYYYYNYHTVLPYNTKTHLCCGGVVLYRLSSVHSCCGQQLYNYRNETCCGNVVYVKSKSSGCCGNVLYDITTAVCCCDRVMSHKDPKGVTCCNGVLYSGNGVCCRNRWFSGSFYRGCCGAKPYFSGYSCCYGGFDNQIYRPSTQICCRGTVLNYRIVSLYYQGNYFPTSRDNGKVFPIYVSSTSHKIFCCDMTPYNYYSHLCCCGRLFGRKRYNSCCGKTPYSTYTHICCYSSGRVYPKSLYTSCCYGLIPYHYVLRRCCSYARLVPYGTSCYA